MTRGDGGIDTGTRRNYKFHAAGGGGFFGDGEPVFIRKTSSMIHGGTSFTHGLTGGTLSSQSKNVGFGTAGGFGGGAAAHSGGSAGGGGFNGGNGEGSDLHMKANNALSFNSGRNKKQKKGSNSDAGRVKISFLERR